jgi:putative addiction module antidote
LLVEFRVKVVKVGNSLRITIPKELIRAMNLKVGDTVALTLETDYIAVRKCSEITEDKTKK